MPRRQPKVGGRILNFVTMLVALVSAAGVSSVGATTAGAEGPVAVAPAPPPEYFGVNAQYIATFPRADWGRYFDAMARDGLRVVRHDARWDLIEKRAPVGDQHVYDWRLHDAVVWEMARRGLRWLPILGFSARWAGTISNDWRSPPADLNAFATYARAVVERYGRGGQFWREHAELTELPPTTFEVWNEPNYPGFWHGGPDAARYIDLYLATRSAVKAADPGARVAIAGLAPEDASDFLRAMYEHRPDARGQVDAIGLHPYGVWPEQVFERLAALRRTMDDIGDANVPIDITEVGWTTQGTGTFRAVPDDVRARYYEETADKIARSDCGVDIFTPHSWVTAEVAPWNQDDWFGIHHPNGRPSRTQRAYAAVVHRLSPAGVRRAEIALCDRRPRLVVQSVRRMKTRSTCFRAQVILGTTRLRGAEVEFRYVVGRSIRSTTGEDGFALACFKNRPRRGRARPAAKLTVHATHSDLAHVASTSLNVARG